jgi:uncharacterized membrane protein YqjE
MLLLLLIAGLGIIGIIIGIIGLTDDINRFIKSAVAFLRILSVCP